MFLQLACHLYLLQAVFAADSCSGRCGQGLNSDYTCQCNTACEGYNDCCSDYNALCKSETCAGRCGAALDKTKPCQCNSACVTHGDCCTDYHALCDDDDTACDISCIATQLWNNDQYRVEGIQLNRQAAASGDNAPQKLFKYVNETYFKQEIYQNFIALLDNYNVNVGQAESLDQAEQLEIYDFVSTLLNTQLMKEAEKWLISKGIAINDFESIVRESWFELYPRSPNGPIDSSGFEHVMVGEIKGSSVSGFHNWIQLYLQEKTNSLNYFGYTDSGSASNDDIDVMAAKFTWNGVTKHFGSFFVGTSPAFEFAIYTICSITSPNAKCEFNVAGKQYSIQTWDVYHKSGFQFGSAYPIV